MKRYPKNFHKAIMSKTLDTKPEKTRNISAMAWEKNYQFTSKEQQFLDSLDTNSVMNKALLEYRKLFEKKHDSNKDITPAKTNNLRKDNDVSEFQEEKKNDSGAQKKIEIPIFTESQEFITKLMIEKYQLMSGLETLNS